MSKSDAEHQFEQLRDDLAKLRSDVTRLLATLGESGRREVDDVADDAKDRLRDAAKAVGNAKDYTLEAAAVVEREVRKYPLLAFFGALSIGCCIGRLWGKLK